jgi:hypothetical protein
MTVSVLRNKVQYGGNDSTTAFTVNFPYTEKSQIKVYLGDTLKSLTTHYTLTDPDSTGTVTFLTPPATGTLVTILRETDFLQTIDYANNDILDAETLESAFDKLTMMCQQVKGLVDKAVGFDDTVNDTDTTSLKLAAGTADLAGKLLAFDSTGAFVTTQEIGTFKGNDTTTTTAAYVVRDLIRDSSNDNVYFTKVNAPSGTLLTNTSYFELLVDVATVRQLKDDAETAKTNAETAETNAEAALASFQGQYKTGTTNPYTGTPDAGDLWYDTTNSILKYYVSGTGFEPVTTSLATVSGNYLTISNQVITAGVVPISLGGTGGTSSSEARTLLGVSIGSDVQAYSVSLQDISSLAKTDGNIIVGDGSNWVAESGSTARASLGVSIGSQVQAWDQQLDDISALAVTDGNIIVGNGTNWVAESGATARASLGLTIGSDVEAYSSTNADYSDTTANFTGTLQNGGSNVLVDSDIGSTVQGYDANTAKLDATTSNFTGTLQNGGSNVVVDSDIGSSVQAWDTQLDDIAALAVTDGNFIVGNGSNWVAESGATARTSLGLGTIATQAANSVSITGGSITGITDVAIADGGTGASTEVDARSNLLPSYSGNGSKVLALNSGGTDVEWVTQSQVFTAGVANAFEHPNSVTNSFTVSASDHRFYVGPVSFTNTVTLQGKMLVFDGLYNTTGTINITGTLHVRG